MVLISYNDLERIRKEYPNKKIIFCSGAFDLTHAGHILFFEDCKKMGDILVVGVGSDKAIRELKGNNRPIINESLRMKMVDSFKPVDYTLLDELTGKKDPHLIFKTVFENLKPDMYVINEDVKDIEERRKLADKFMVKLLVLKRNCPKEFDNISTTKIIDKIKNLDD